MTTYFNKRYQKIRLLDNGGMSTVYLAKDLLTNREVAIKVLDEKLSKDVLYKKRFVSEVKLTMQINSPFVVKIIDFHWDDKIQFFVMEFIDGKQLREVVRASRRLAEDEAVYFTSQIALGLENMHRHGIIHRDVKPQNIMVQPNSKIKIIDLGIAKGINSEQLTQTGIIIASVQYVAPEILTGEPATVQSDIYALGIMLYFLTQGEVPFRSIKDNEIISMHKKSPLPSMKYVSQRLENIIVKATEKNPDRRYKTMLDMYSDLKALLP